MLNAFLIYIIYLLKKKISQFSYGFKSGTSRRSESQNSNSPSSSPSYFPQRAFALLLKIHTTFLIGGFQLVSQNLTQLDKHHIPNKLLNFWKNKKPY